MRIIIIGSVAAGTSVAAKARRNSEENEIVIYDRDSDISYSACGLPYFIGDDEITREDITPRDAQWFMKRLNIDIKICHDVISVNFDRKELIVKNTITDEKFQDKYDKLIIATGAIPIKPNIKGIKNDNIFVLKKVSDADKIIQHIKKSTLYHAVIIGGGFVGMEMAENLRRRGFDISIVEKQNHIMPSMDSDMAIYVEKYLKDKGIKLYTKSEVLEITNNGKEVLISQKIKLKSDIIILATGIKAETELFKNSSLKTGKHGGILINEKMETNINGVYAAGDCCEVRCLITGRNIYQPRGSTSNKMGRIAGDVVTGGSLRFRGILNTSILKIFDLTVAQTGLTEKEAIELDYDIEIIHNIKENISKYLKESSNITIKALADRKTGQLIGSQIIGEAGVDKRIDVFATAITFKAKVSDLFYLDLAYAPPFSTTKDPVMYTGMILDNAIDRNIRIITPKKLASLLKKENSVIIIDVRSKSDYAKGRIKTAINIPLAELREKITEIRKNSLIVTHCNKGVSGKIAQDILLNSGFTEVYNISGGYSNFSTQNPEFIEKNHG